MLDVQYTDKFYGTRLSIRVEESGEISITVQGGDPVEGKTTFLSCRLPKEVAKIIGNSLSLEKE